MEMLCDICGYKGKIDKDDPKYLMLFDIKYVDTPPVPESSIRWLGEYQICSNCRKTLLAFINEKRADHGMKEFMSYETHVAKITGGN